MDPTTTLFTFMLQTHPSVNTVHLVGSWDNFSRAHTMERDVRRNGGQWRGCHSFKDITCDGDVGSTPRRDGGLKMGHMYYYYYELDGAAETHDPTEPSTNTCPYLPGQTVNTLWMPVEQSGRKRSASLTSLREEKYMTMNPADKFVTPRPPPPVPSETSTMRRVGSAPLFVQHKRSARSLSPASGWTFSPRKLFSRKTSSSSLKDRCQSPSPEDERSSRAGEGSQGSRSRDISPESLRRFLVDDLPQEEEYQVTDRPAIAIPEDIVEENEDDDNFATSAVSETLAFGGLSPPPAPRSMSPSPSPTVVSLAATLLATPAGPAPPTRPPPCVPQQQLSPIVAQSRFSFSDASFYSHNSPRSPGSNSLPSFYHSDDEEDEDFVAGQDEDDYLALSCSFGITSPTSDADSFARNLTATLSTYSLPQSSADHHQQGGAGKLSVVVPSGHHQSSLGSPAVVARGGTDDALPMGNTSLLTSPIPNSGLDDLMNELGWMADVIRGKSIS
ncbi:hypothetical protein B0H66DRAFT_554427 [Apodospora peruviana]|uniref:Uncharacterized protein n=1 Tax=Apodospora peruviana TaxID=516989 RepID=A0AAE0IC68_9PEZI|nr:hypothetical protein B0H66DRAFT_554427 [Apodospora peruviana]